MLVLHSLCTSTVLTLHRSTSFSHSAFSKSCVRARSSFSVAVSRAAKAAIMSPSPTPLPDILAPPPAFVGTVCTRTYAQHSVEYDATTGRHEHRTCSVRASRTGGVAPPSRSERNFATAFFATNVSSEGGGSVAAKLASSPTAATLQREPSGLHHRAIKGKHSRCTPAGAHLARGPFCRAAVDRPFRCFTSLCLVNSIVKAHKWPRCSSLRKSASPWPLKPGHSRSRPLAW